VRLKAGERWTFHPSKGHDVAWIASHQGIVTTPEQVSMGEVAVFEEGDQAIEFEALPMPASSSALRSSTLTTW
jgi:hypothetical protein